MRYFAKLNYLGRPVGFWPNDIFPDTLEGERNVAIPAEAIEITSQVYQVLRDDQTKAYLQGKIVDYVPPVVPPGPPVVPEMVTRRQFLLALYKYSITAYNKIIEFVHNHDYPPIAIEFDNALYFYRNSNTLAAVAADPTLDFTSAQIDAVFLIADKITD